MPYRRSLFPLAIVFRFVAHLRQELAQQRVARPEGGKRPQDDAQIEGPGGSIEPAQTPQHQQAAQEQHHREAEEKYWRRSLVLAWAGFAVAAVGLSAAFFAYREAAIQAAAAVATSRPWLIYDVDRGGPLTTGPDGSYVSLRSAVRNLGHSPALRVKNALFPIVGEAALHEAEASCEALKGANFKDVGSALFSDDSSVKPLAEVATRRWTFRKAKIDGKPTSDRALYVLACVAYDFGDGRSHGTQRIYSLERRKADGGEGTTPLTDGAQISLDDFLLVERLGSAKAD